jgi:hypothetical protein
MKSPLHIIALLIFALTQCLAPFVHAHVDGLQSDATFHAHDLPHHLYLPSELSQSHIESYESPAISIPHEYQRDTILVVLDVYALSFYPSTSAINRYAINSSASLRALDYAYFKPHTQAPPSSV